MSTRCGSIAIVGRPNVGKSTFLNRVLNQKLSITSRKPQTTRYQILGLHTVGDTQLIFVDTPGWQRQPRNQLNRLMNKEVTHALTQVDCALMICDARHWDKEDALVAEMLSNYPVVSILALNKLDHLKKKSELLPRIQSISEKFPRFDEYFPMSAKRGDGVDEVVACLARHSPEGEFLFPEGQLTDRSERFLSAEIVREKTMRYLGDELPYQTSVVIDEFSDEDELTRILATVWVGRESHKGIVIGKNGQLMKRIASDARREIEQLLGRKVFLKVWVKTRHGWADSKEALQELGLSD
ncbi:MAG: GTPase Era [Gammaproteobacteria bacterium]